MILHTVVRDCLYLNWSLPLEALPAAPEPLRYEVHEHEGGAFVFASALLFRHEHLRLESVPGVRLSYPQFNLRLYVTDGEGVPSMLLHCVLVPGWVLPAARWVGRQRVGVGRFRYAEPAETGDGRWRWSVQRGGGLKVEAREGAPQIGHGPRLGSWEKTVCHLRNRPRGYAAGPGGLRRIETTHSDVSVVPLRVEIRDRSLLADCLKLPASEWPPLHSAWLCPEIPFVFELAAVGEAALARRVPAPG